MSDAVEGLALPVCCTLAGNDHPGSLRLRVVLPPSLALLDADYIARKARRQRLVPQHNLYEKGWFKSHM
jgi:hypothetical protein